MVNGSVGLNMGMFAKRLIRGAFFRAGYRVKRLTEEERRYMSASYDASGLLPDGAADTLRPDNPRLKELRSAYRALALPVCDHTVWEEARLSRELTLPWFRGDNAYVWQFRQMHSEARLKQYLILKCVEENDDLGLLKQMEEDGAFGCWTFRYGQRPPVSRDLLESVNEINFLDRQLGIADIQDLKVLDIGAGYGRLAYRMSLALDNLSRYDCVDAVPESTFLCEYYLKFRGIDNRASAVPLHELSRLAAPGEYHLAVNIHSFSECTIESVTWWLGKLSELKVPYLLIVPNQPEKLLTTEADGSKKDFSSVVDEAGYELIHKVPVYDKNELLDLINIRDHFFLYRRRNV